MSQRMTKPSIRLVRPAKTDISLRIRAVWSESSLITFAFYNLQAIQRGINENPCCTGWMYRLIWVFADCRFCRALAQIKRYIWHHWRTKKEELRQSNRLGRVGRKNYRGFGSIVYNRTTLYKCQNFLIDQCCQTARLTKSRYRLFIAVLFSSLWRQSAVDRGFSVKHGPGHLGYWQTVQTQIRRRKTRRLIRVHCLFKLQEVKG